MNRADTIFATLLAVSGALIATGAWMLLEPLGPIVGGVELAWWSWIVLGDEPDDEAEA